MLKKLNKELEKSKIGEIEKGNIKSRFLNSVDDARTLMTNLTALYTTGAPIVGVVAKRIQG